MTATDTTDCNARHSGQSIPQHEGLHRLGEGGVRQIGTRSFNPIIGRAPGKRLIADCSGQQVEWPLWPSSASSPIADDQQVIGGSRLVLLDKLRNDRVTLHHVEIADPPF